MGGLSPSQVLQLPLPADADVQIIAGTAAAVAAAQQAAEGTYQPQQPRYNQLAGPYASWPELADAGTVQGLISRVMPQAAALAALMPEDVANLQTRLISDKAAVKQLAADSIGGVQLAGKPGLLVARRLIAGHCKPLHRQLGQVLSAAAAPGGDGLRGFFTAALAVFKEEWGLGSFLHPLQKRDPTACLHNTVCCRVRFAYLLVRIFNLLLPPLDEEQRAPAAATAAAPSVADADAAAPVAAAGTAAAAAAEQDGVQAVHMQEPLAVNLPKAKPKARKKVNNAQEQQAEQEQEQQQEHM